MLIKKAAGHRVRVGLRGRFEPPNPWILGVVWLCTATSAAVQTRSAPQPFVEELRQQERSVDARLRREAPAAAVRRQQALAERGWLIRNDIGWALDALGATGGVVGLRGTLPLPKGLSYDVFVGAPIKRPEGYRTAKTTAGFNLNFSFSFSF